MLFLFFNSCLTLKSIFLEVQVFIGSRERQNLEKKNKIFYFGFPK